MSSERLHIHIRGSVAEDKDYARELRTTNILPALSTGAGIVIDFSAVTTATQSFLHALLSEAIRIHGEEVLEVVVFKGCVREIQQLIGTVVEYSLRARTLTQEGLSGTLRKSDVPQADSLRTIRQVLDAIAEGRAAPQDIADATGFSFRHVHYRLHAARVLGLVRMGKNVVSLSTRGRTLAALEPESPAEREAFKAAVVASDILKKICPNLLDRRAPTSSELSRRFQQKTGLSPATALRRANSVLAWRRYLVELQPPLPGVRI